MKSHGTPKVHEYSLPHGIIRTYNHDFNAPEVSIWNKPQKKTLKTYNNKNKSGSDGTPLEYKLRKNGSFANCSEKNQTSDISQKSGGINNTIKHKYYETLTNSNLENVSNRNSRHSSNDQYKKPIDNFRHAIYQ